MKGLRPQSQQSQADGFKRSMTKSDSAQKGINAAIQGPGKASTLKKSRQSLPSNNESENNLKASLVSNGSRKGLDADRLNRLSQPKKSIAETLAQIKSKRFQNE